MKRYLKNFKLSKEFVENSIYDCIKGSSSVPSKWGRADVAVFFAEYIQKYVSQFTDFKIPFKILVRRIRKLSCNNHECLKKIIKYISEEIYNEICEKRISLKPIYYEDRFDQHSGKIRSIGLLTIKQQIYDYILVNACKEMFMAKIGYYQCACVPGRGQVFGKNAIEKWIRQNPKDCQWLFKADVKKFYPSINHDLLKNLLRRDIKNETILYILFTLIDTFKEGLCIGSFLSQYLANYIMSYAYHYVSEKLYTERREKRINLVNHVIFYMDDILLIGSSKKNVKKAAQLLEKYFNEVLLLNLKPSYQLFPLDSRPIDMMGYQIYTYKTTVREKTFKRANKVFKKVKDKENVSLLEAYRVVAYYGFFKHSDSKNYIKKMKLYKSLNKAKEIISNEQKRSNIYGNTTFIPLYENG